MQIKQISYESNGFTFIDHQNGPETIPWLHGNRLHFEKSKLEVVKGFHDALSDFLEEVGEEISDEIFEVEDDELFGLKIEFDTDKEWFFPFEVAMTAMRRWLKVREKKWDKWLYSAMKDWEFEESKKGVIEITSEEMFQWSREILPPKKD